MDIELYRDLESFHAWAMGRVFGLCRQLDTDALQANFPLGPGTALATLQHMAWAEQIWLNRWQGKSMEPTAAMPESLDDLAASFAALAQSRSTWLQSKPQLIASTIDYTNLKGEAFQQNLGELVLHVLNHAVHHRAQVLHFLKRQGKVVVGGLDYIFYRIAVPTLALQPQVADACRQWGLEVGETVVPYAAPEMNSLIRYSSYGDWATQLVFDQTQDLSDAQLDHDWGMGLGSIRKTLLHLYDAECFWQANWARSGSPFNHSSQATTIAELSEKWAAMAANRLQLMHAGARQLGSSATVDFGGGPLEFRWSESLIQLAVHGTLHRAQLSNMIRSSGRTPQANDYVVWMRQL